MKKTLLISSLLLIFIPSIYGQKAKTKKIIVKQNHLPIDPLSNDIKTYTSEFSNHSTESINFKQSQLEIKGLERQSKENADIIVQFTITKASVDGILKSHKLNQSGSKIEVNASFETKVKLDFKCTLNYKNGLLIQEIKIPEYDELTSLVTKTSNKKITAEKTVELTNKKIKDARVSFNEKTVNIIIKKFTDATQNYLDKNYGYYIEEIEFNIASGKGKKHDYSDLDQALNIFQEAAKLYSENQLTEEVKTKLIECISIWNNAISEYKTGEKKARISDKNILPIYHNLTIAYYLLDDFENALTSCKKEIAFGEKDTLMEKIIERKNAMNKKNNNDI